MKLIPLLAAVLVANATGLMPCERANAAGPDVPPSEFHLFLLAGQSNMAGRGKVEAEDHQSHERVWSFSQDGEWEPASDPLHFDKPRVVGVGLGKTFAIDYAEKHPGIQVGLIPCAAGGSSIRVWEPGGFHDQTRSHPYDDALRRTQMAMRSGTLKGILWHQGESDSNEKRSETYEEGLHALVARFREALKSDELPFIVGQMGRFPGRPWGEGRRRVDAAHRSLPDKVGHTAFVSAHGLGHKGDRTHFDSPAYRELGHRFLDAWQNLANDAPLQYTIDRSVAHKGFDGRRCWVHARAGIVAPDESDSAVTTLVPRVVMTTQELQLSGSDVFYALHQLTSDDLGASWSEPRRLDSFARQKQADGREVTVCDFTPTWHAGRRRLLGTGQTVWYEDNRVMRVRDRATAYAFYDHETDQWTPWSRLQMPDEPKFRSAGAGSVQRLDREGDQLLLPIYFKRPEQTQYSTTVLRCRLVENSLEYVEHGNEMTVDVKRGLYEPSVTEFAGRFFLTMRNDNHGYVSVSEDGLTYGPVKKWTFDDGSDLGNYNTQQHWVTHSDGLYLVYTRRGADNDHVFRHRAPLFMARVDPERLCVIRSSERVLVPEAGARLGNFGVVSVNAGQTWVVVSEWMQPEGVEKHGSDNRIHVVKLRWNRPNRDVSVGDL